MRRSGWPDPNGRTRLQEFWKTPQMVDPGCSALENPIQMVEPPMAAALDILQRTKNRPKWSNRDNQSL
jgi:hypothetical protein